MLKHLILLLAIFTASTVVAAQPASAQANAKQAEKTAKVKTSIRKVGIGTDSVVRVKLYDQTQYKGYISRVGDDDFEITDSSKNAHSVRYADVRSIGGKNMSTGAKIGIGIGIGAGATILVLLLILASLD